MRAAYLDSSAIVKRYILEVGGDVTLELYGEALRGDAVLITSL